MSARIVVDADPIAAAVSLISESLAAVDEPRIAVPGGSAARVLGGLRDALGSRWADLRLTYTDERCVPTDDLESTRGTLLREGLLSEDDPPRFELPLFKDGEHPSSAALRAGRALDERFGGALDVVVLGMGPDGHVASLFPGVDVKNDEGFVGYVVESPKPPAERVTLTRRTLERAGARVVVAFGESKREALTRTLAEDNTLPLTGCGDLTIVTDLEGLVG